MDFEAWKQQMLQRKPTGAPSAQPSRLRYPPRALPTGVVWPCRTSKTLLGEMLNTDLSQLIPSHPTTATTPSIKSEPVCWQPANESDINEWFPAATQHKQTVASDLSPAPSIAPPSPGRHMDKLIFPPVITDDDLVENGQILSKRKRRKLEDPDSTANRDHDDIEPDCV